MTKAQFKQALDELGDKLGLDLSEAPIPDNTDTDYEALFNVTKAVFAGKIQDPEAAFSNYAITRMFNSLDEDDTEECDDNSEQEDSESKYDNLAALANTAILGALEANYYKLLEDPLSLKPEQLVALARLQSSVSE